MRNRTFYTLFISLLAFTLFTNFSGGLGISGQDRTGGPFAITVGGQPTFCSTCHTGTPFNASIAVELLDGGAPVMAYEPGKTYTMRYVINHSTGNPSRYGFQAVALTTAGNENAGMFAAAPAGMRTPTIQGRRYVEHSTPRANNAFEIGWTAPPAGTGSVTVYAAGNATNGNGSSNGDNGAVTTATFTEAMPTATTQADLPGLSLLAFPNPMGHTLHVEVESDVAATYRLSLTDLAGRELHAAPFAAGTGLTRHTLHVQHLSPGVYVLRLTDGPRTLVRKVVK